MRVPDAILPLGAASSATGSVCRLQYIEPVRHRNVSCFHDTPIPTERLKTNVSARYYFCTTRRYIARRMRGEGLIEDDVL